MTQTINEMIKDIVVDPKISCMYCGFEHPCGCDHILSPFSGNIVADIYKCGACGNYTEHIKITNEIFIVGKVEYGYERVLCNKCGKER